MRRVTLPVLAAVALLAISCGDSADWSATATTAAPTSTTQAEPATTTTEATAACPVDDFLLEVNDVVRRALFIVAHPDDPEYGAAAAVARWTDQGKEITYLLVTRGEAGIDSLSPAEAGPLRAEEQVRAAAEVGVDTVEFLDGHHDGVIEYGVPLRRDLAAAIRRHRPDLVLGINHRTTWPGGGLNMADHTAVGRAIPDACRDAANRWVFADQLDDGLEPWDGVRRVAFAASPEPTHAVDVGATWEQGERSLAQHRVYLDSVGAPGYLRPMAEAEGQAFGCELAVTWELIDL